MDCRPPALAERTQSLSPARTTAAATLSAGRGPTARDRERLGTWRSGQAQGRRVEASSDILWMTANGWYTASTATDPEAVAAGRKFVSAFREAHDEAPGPFAAETYDAVCLLARCVRELKRERSSRQDLVPILRGTKHTGVSKEYAFEEENGMFTGDGVFF